MHGVAVDLTPRNPGREGMMAGVSAWSHSFYLESGLGLDTSCRLCIVWADRLSRGLTAH